MAMRRSNGTVAENQGELRRSDQPCSPSDSVELGGTTKGSPESVSAAACVSRTAPGSSIHRVMIHHMSTATNSRLLALNSRSRMAIKWLYSSIDLGAAW